MRQGQSKPQNVSSSAPLSRSDRDFFIYQSIATGYMSRRRTLWLLLPDSLRRLPADLAAVIAIVVLANAAVFLPLIRETPLRIVIGLPLVLFVPGYALITALFPEDGAAPSEQTEAEHIDTTSRDGIDGIERVALSFGLSIAVVPLVGLVLNFTPWGIRLVPIMIAISGVTLLLTGVAARRRWAVPVADRFAVPYREWYRSGRAELIEPPSRTDAILNVVLVVSVLLAVGSVGYAVAVPKQGESFSEFYLLTENETGALVADDYTTEFGPGESRELVVGIGNQEHERVNYTVIAEIQRVRTVGNQTQIQESTELRRFEPSLEHNETWTRQHTVTPQMTGDRLRLQYLLYKNDPQEPLNRSGAYRELHLWVNVSQQP